MSESEWIRGPAPTIKNPIYDGNKEFKTEIDGSNNYKLINIESNKYSLFRSCDCEYIIKYNIKYKESYYNEKGIYDIVIYDFELIWNTIKKTYWINDIKNGEYETNIIGNVNSDESTKEQNTQFLKGETFISYVFEEPITYKNIIDDCF